MGETGNDDAGQANHWRCIVYLVQLVNWHSNPLNDGLRRRVAQDQMLTRIEQHQLATPSRCPDDLLCFTRLVPLGDV